MHLKILREVGGRGVYMYLLHARAQTNFNELSPNNAPLGLQKCQQNYSDSATDTLLRSEW